MNSRHLLSFLAFVLACGAGFGQAASAPAAPAKLTVPPAFDDQDDVPLPDPDLWHRIRMGFVLEPMESALVAENEAWYAGRPEYIKRFVDRGSLYLHHIVEEVEKRGMPTEIALLPVIESAFTPKAYSRAKASGLWQFIPSTGKNYGLTQDWWRDNRNDVVASTSAALNYLQRLYDMFGSWELALAAYNCGEGRVSRAIAANQKKGLATDYLSLKLPDETRNYVPRLIAVKNIVLAPASYGIELESVPNQPYFTAVPAPQKIDVPLAAKLADMSVAEFVALNPAHNKPVAVAPTGTLIVPLDKADTFRENLESYDKPFVTWTTTMGKKGESLDAIAKRHHVAPAELRAVNDSLKLDKNQRLKSAQQVLVPMVEERAGKSIASTKPAPVQVAKAATANDAVSADASWYTVRAGDTLYSIARRANLALERLLHLNGLTSASVLKPGLKLRLQ
jgi:membrane-bound lytic murein transglycosylase D